jgi:hypothetical protein
MLNIIHCHLNDMGEDATLEVVHMLPRDENDGPAEYMNLGNGQIACINQDKRSDEEVYAEYMEFKADA